MKRGTLILVTLALFAILCWLFPLFHLVPLKQEQGRQTAAEFNATNFATTFWNERLLKSLDRAADAGQVLTALSADSQKARTQFGRTLGMSSSTLFFLRGTGHVVSVNKKGVALALKDGGDTVDILLPTGLLFGNAVRDVKVAVERSDELRRGEGVDFEFYRPRDFLRHCRIACA